MRKRQSSIKILPWRFFPRLSLAIGISAIFSITSLIVIRSGAVELRPISSSVTELLSGIGRGLASKADAKLKGEVGKYARENMILGITGDLIPSGEVTYVRGGACTQNGRPGAGMEFRVHARAKVDVGTRKLGVNAVRKVWAVDTVQIVQILAFPKHADNGSVGVDVAAEVMSASATPERQAKQEEANAFRDRVESELRSNLSKLTGEVDLQRLFQLLNQ